MNEIKSDISGFYKLSIEERIKLLSNMIDFTPDELKILGNHGYFDSKELDLYIENVIASYQLPLGIAFYFKINKKDYLIPMVTEEPSVIAAASNAAKITRKKGGFETSSVRNVMIGQIQLINSGDELNTIQILLDHKDDILKLANEQDPKLIELGGGAIDLQIREIITGIGKMLILHLLVDVKDALGANIVNTMAEAVSPYIEEITGGKIYLRIISNLPMHRIVTCRAVFDKDVIGGEEVIESIMNAYHFALADPYRAATHNKGIMNGIVALALATGNDTRAIESAAHAYASLKGIYSPLTSYHVNNKTGNLIGEIELPVPIGTFGGIINKHPMVKIALKILNVHSAEELAQVAAALGLAQNFAALKALATEGIQKGHMKLHARKNK